MRQIFALAALLAAAFASSAQPQQVLLLVEDFELPSQTFVFDTGANAIGGTTGANQWIINNVYDGAGVHPNTTSQDSTVIGTIGNAPFSTYLHIYDSSGTVLNANYNNASASSRFAYTYDGFCTLGLTDVTLAFFLFM